MSENKQFNGQLDLIRDEQKRVRSRRNQLQKKIKDLSKKKKQLELAPVSTEVIPYQPEEPENSTTKELMAQVLDIEKWAERLQTSQKTLEQVGVHVGKSLNTVGALIQVAEAVKAVQAAKVTPVPRMQIDENDPDVKYLRVAKSLLEAVRHPAVRQLVVETTRALKTKRV